MIWLSLLVFFPLLGGVVLFLAAYALPSARQADLARWGALIVSVVECVLATALWWQAPETSVYYLERYNWIPSIGVHYLLVMDGLNGLLVLLTGLIGPIAVLASWKGVKKHWPAFALLLLATEAGIMGVFLALDLVLFYVFWELMLVPMYFIIGVWGHERRLYAAYKFFLYTMAGSLLMLVSILGIYYLHGQQSGQYTFDYYALLNTKVPLSAGLWIMLGFFAAFAVKIPVFPVHSWLPDAHTEAPTAGSIILAGLLLKTGAYGLLRFNLPLFPEASMAAAPWFMALGVIGIVYGALLALRQTDMKRLIAYSSISHLGFVVLGAYGAAEQALNGALVLMLAHGVTTAAMFALVGMLEERCGTRQLSAFGGLFAPMPAMGGFLMFFTLSAMGMPGLANFVGEFLVLAGVYTVSPLWAVSGAMGIIAGVVYLLWMYQRVMLGELNNGGHTWVDLEGREFVLLSLLAASVLFLGLYPTPFLESVAPALKQLSAVLLAFVFAGAG